MKTQVHFASILATILAMTLAYIGGSLVSAQPRPLLTEPHAPTLIEVQWAAPSAASSLLLVDGEDDTITYLPLVLK